MENNLPKRKALRLVEFDYNTPGAYFITVCTRNREPIFWLDCRGELCSPGDIPLSEVGIIVDREIQRLDATYNALCVEKYCIMPNHIHLIVAINTDENGRTQFAPTISRAVKQFKGAVTKQTGYPIWQRSYYDHVIRNQEDYNMIAKYMEENPLRWELGKLYSAE